MKKIAFRLLFCMCFLLITQQRAAAQLEQCKAVLENDTLTLENSIVKRVFCWNKGALQHIALYNKIGRHSIAGITIAGKADMHLPGVKAPPDSSSFRTYSIPATNASYACLAAEVLVKTGTLQVKRVFKIFPGSPAIVCDYYFRGQAGNWQEYAAEGENFKNIEDNKAKKAGEGQTMIADRIAISGNHWRVKTVEFFDATDYNNNLVREYNGLLYFRENKLRGNLLLARNQLNEAACFILKEAPVSVIQLQYQGFDFSTTAGEIKVAGCGVAPQNLHDTDWVRGYSVVVGIGETNGEAGLLQSLRHYQSLQRVYKEERDAMILSNTWGDRNRDSRINEKFILQELEAAARLGVTHYQIDDGWQTGISSNSALGGSLINIWRNPHYWEVDSIKFPNGLATVIAAAKKRNIQLTLWFNPSTDSSFKNWEKDADVLIAQYKRYGIAMWKIDGVQIPDKQADINFRKFLDKVTAATHYNGLFNLDVTAGRRFGYNYMHTYGNLFLENRYTDWTNYYPHYTLRNLWQLSRYIAPQRLQIEFLNKWRNADKYPAADILAPATYSFDYLFAISMVAQPLAWFEASGLPAEAFGTAKLISKYKSISKAMHKGSIFPVGDEPDGFSWTGFQSVQDKTGFFLLFRENNMDSNKIIQTLLPPGKHIDLKIVAGQGSSFETVTGKQGSIGFKLAQPKTFALYQYTVL